MTQRSEPGKALQPDLSVAKIFLALTSLYHLSISTMMTFVDDEEEEEADLK